MILLTRRFRSSEGSSQSGLYFTERSLSSHGTLLRPGCQTPTGDRSAGRTLTARRRSQGACRLYFTDYTLAGQQNASHVSEVRRQQATPSVQGVVSTVLAIFISPITL